MEPFHNRLQAGQLLSQQLKEYAGRQDAVVVALPRGGVPVGFAIASRLECPLDVMPVAKLGVPGHDGVALGAISSRGVCVLRPETISLMDIAPDAIEAIAQRELTAMKQRERSYRAVRPPLDLKDKVVIVADDGLASGATMLAATRALRHEQPAQIIVAVPVASADSITELRTEVQNVVCLMVPDWLTSVDQWYEDSAPVEDAKVMEYLREMSHGYVAARNNSHAAGSMQKPPQGGTANRLY
ncbi:putative phosphoribosyltransferase [Paucimonas lemoignei]|uniref:Putative phosphoribosyltransferase n=1 Tax=Paucimonas lemoignei TaxID=29443 RepID=A0A4R3HRS0_PAULE|nr:phosphoribosyltransferase family protein [Paucimonas lemoignei]TCS34705.1 putative phosphoribosyltransferase [Paucimonas lemoignei]